MSPFPLSLTPYERFMWRNDSPGYPSMFSMWLDLRGEVDEHLLDRALAESIAWHPLLSAVISGRGRRARWVPAGSPPALVDWRADSRTPIEPPAVSREPGLRVVGARRPDGADLVFHFHHASLDGVAATELLGDFFAAYGQLVAGQSHAEPVRQLDPQALRGRNVRSPASGSAGRRMAHGTTLARRFAKALAFRPSVLAPVRRKGSDQDPGALFRLPEVRLDNEQMSALRRLAREAGASLNDLLLVEVFLAIRRWNADNGGGGRIRLLMPTSQRTAEHASTPAANIVGFEPIDRAVDEATDARKLLEDVRRETATIKQLRQPSWLEEWLALLAKAPPLLDGLIKLPSSLYTGIVSNLGAPAEHFWSHLPQRGGKVVVGNALLEGVGFAPPVRPKSSLSVGITAYGGELSITGKASPFTIGAPGLERFLEQLGEQLRQRASDSRLAEAS